MDKVYIKYVRRFLTYIKLMPYGMSRKSTVWKIRISAFLSHSVSRKRTFSKVSRVMAPYGQVHAKMHFVHGIIVLWGFNFLRYGLCSHLMTYNTGPSKYPGLWPPGYFEGLSCIMTTIAKNWILGHIWIQHIELKEESTILVTVTFCMLTIAIRDTVLPAMMSRNC